jgi:hemoglobin-like flavoprotein
VTPPELTTSQKRIVVDTWKQIKDKALVFGTLMYGHILTIAPAVKPLFSDVAMMQAKLPSMIGLIIKLCEDDEVKVLKKRLWQLGRDHVSYGAKEDHLVVFKQAMFLTLEDKEMLGKLTPEQTAAWSNALQLVFFFMKKGMRDCKNGVTTFRADNKKCLIQ